MWIAYALGSALFAGLTSILAKCGIRKTDSTVATAIRTIVVLLFSWLMVWIAGSQNQIRGVSERALCFLEQRTEIRGKRKREIFARRKEPEGGVAALR